MKLGLKRENRADELEKIKQNHSVELYSPQNSNDYLFVRYIDSNTHKDRTALYCVSGVKDETVTHTLHYSLLSHGNIERVIKTFLDQPYTPDEWLDTHRLYQVPNNEKLPIGSEYCLHAIDPSLHKSYYFTLSSPLVAVGKLSSFCAELRERIELSTQETSYIEHHSAKKILMEIAANHEKRINYIRPGDVIFTNNSKFSKVDSKSLKDQNCRYSHVGIFVSHGLVREATISRTSTLIERVFRKIGVSNQPTEISIDCKNVREVASSWVINSAKNGWTVVRPIPTVLADLNTDISPALFDTGKRYSTVRGLSKAGLNFVLRKNIFEGSDNPDYFICTQYVNYVLRSIANSYGQTAALEVQRERVADASFFKSEHDWQAPNTLFSTFMQAQFKVICSHKT
jgi:hypothetical protein